MKKITILFAMLFVMVGCGKNPLGPAGYVDVINFSNPGASVASITILSGDSRVILTTSTTASSYQWDAKDKDSNFVEGGLYLYQVVISGQSTQSGTIRVIR